MPELPEVEVIRQSLEKKINQKRVKKVIIKNRNLRFKIPHNFEDFLENLKITKVDRFSKYLILHLSNRSYCIIHLGMSGTIHSISKKQKKTLLTNTSFYHSPLMPNKHNHVEIIFEDLKIIYNDPRRFGFFQIIKNKDLLKKRFLSLGPEPFDPKFNKDYIYISLKKKEKKIKDLLIDQSFVSGIGNIYASEILFLCKIYPEIKGKSLTIQECGNLEKKTKKVLEEAILKGGSTIRDFKNTVGLKGNFQKSFKVYQREGMICKRHKCNGIIQKKKFSNRSTFLCNICQKK